EGDAERIDDAPQETATDGNIHDCARALDRVAFLDGRVRTEDHDADIVRFEVKRHAAYAAGKLDHFTGLNIVEAVNARDAVADGENLADFADFRFGTEILDLAFEDGGDFGWLDVHGSIPSIGSRLASAHREADAVQFRPQ